MSVFQGVAQFELVPCYDLEGTEGWRSRLLHFRCSLKSSNSFVHVEESSKGPRTRASGPNPDNYRLEDDYCAGEAYLLSFVTFTAEGQMLPGVARVPGMVKARFVACAEHPERWVIPVEFAETAARAQTEFFLMAIFVNGELVNTTRVFFKKSATKKRREKQDGGSPAKKAKIGIIEASLVLPPASPSPLAPRSRSHRSKKSLSENALASLPHTPAALAQDAQNNSVALVPRSIVFHDESPATMRQVLASEEAIPVAQDWRVLTSADFQDTRCQQQQKDAAETNEYPNPAPSLAELEEQLLLSDDEIIYPFFSSFQEASELVALF